MRAVARWIVVLSLVLGSSAAFIPAAGAHDNECTTTVHVGAAQVHFQCEGHRPDGSHCMASVKVAFVHESFVCE